MNFQLKGYLEEIFTITTPMMERVVLSRLLSGVFFGFGVFGFEAVEGCVTDLFHVPRAQGLAIAFGGDFSLIWRQFRGLCSREMRFICLLENSCQEQSGYALDLD